MLTLKQYINEQAELESLILEMSDDEFDALLENVNAEEMEVLEGIFGTIARGVGAVAKGAGKLAAKGAKAAGKAAIKKGKEKFTTKGKADAADRKAAKLAAKKKDMERLLKAKELIKKDREALKKLKAQGKGDSVLSKLRDKIKQAVGKKKEMEAQPA